MNGLLCPHVDNQRRVRMILCPSNQVMQAITAESNHGSIRIRYEMSSFCKSAYADEIMKLVCYMRLADCWCLDE